MKRRNPALPNKSYADAIFGAQRVELALERHNGPLRVNPEDLTQIARQSREGHLAEWVSSMPEDQGDAIILLLAGLGAEPDDVRVSQSFPAELIARAEELAHKRGVSRADVLRWALSEGLERLGA